MLHIQISRFIKKIEKDDKFLTSCLTIAREAEHKVMQNNCVDIYRCDHHGNVTTVSKSCNWCQGLLQLRGWHHKRNGSWPQDHCRLSWPQWKTTSQWGLLVYLTFLTLVDIRRPDHSKDAVLFLSRCPDGGSSIAIAYCSPVFLGLKYFIDVQWKV